MKPKMEAGQGRICAPDFYRIAGKEAVEKT
jgi:hypothetical protein